MAQPSQEYPPWLTPVPSVITNAAGNPVATVVGVSYIAPTYYGPSIPLGTLYSYGGYTFPPTVVWPGSPTTAPIPTAVATTGVSGATTISTALPITTGLPTTAMVPPSTISSMTIVTTSGTSIMSSTTPGVTLSTPIPTTATPSSLTSTPVTPTSTISAPSGLTSVIPTSPTISASSGLTSVIPTSPTISASSGLTSVIPTSPTISASSGLTSMIPTSTTISVPSSTGSSVSSSTSQGAPAPSVSPSGISNATGLTKGQLVGIVVASVLGLIFLFVLALFLFLWFKALKNRRQYATLSPIDDDYVVVPPGGRLPGEGSPRHSGEEHDSFLRPLGETSAAAAVVAAASSRPRGPQATANSNSSESTNSHASGFGVLLDKPSIGFSPSIPEEHRTGRPLSPSDLQRLGREDVLPEEVEYEDGEYSGAYAYSTSPPAHSRLDPAAAPLLGSAALPFRPSKSSLRGEPEEATVHTARRVKVEELGPRELADPSSRRKSSNGILNAIGLGGLANLARKSWFKHFDSPRQSGVAASEVEPLSEKDIEAGHEALTTERAVDSFGIRTRERPVSRVSAQSGASGTTQYHDAQSSLQGGASSVTPPPRALTPVDQPPMNEQTWASSPLAGPPIYDDRPPAPSTPPRNNSQTSFEFPAGVDILDIPAPTALTHFASISSTKDSYSGSSFGVKPFLFPPPGLDTIRAIGWVDSQTESGGSSYGFTSGRHIPSPGDPDVLEEAPPAAENGWRSIAADSNRRGTFGTYVQGHDFASERASLFSMRSHLSPSTRSTGSAPVGPFEIGSVNSSASRPSAHSRSASSGMHSLVHQGSIPSELRRNNGSVAHSPVLSAFGMRPPSRASARLDMSFDSMTVGTPPLVHVSPHKSDAGRSMASGSTTLFDISSRTLRGLPTPPRSNSASPLSANFQLPWVGGLAHDWQPAP